MMISARCERSREAISLRADGNLSLFERRLLDRHLRGCFDCRGFATSVEAQTRLLREAPLEPLPAPIALPAGHSRAGKRVAGILSATAAVAAAATGAFFVAHHPAAAGKTSAASVGSASLIDVATPAAQGTTVIPRPKLVSGGVDAAVRGLFSIPT